MPTLIRRPVQPARIVSLKTPQLHGSFQGLRPRVSIIQVPRSRPAPKPIVIHTRSLPNIPAPSQRWVPRPLVAWDRPRLGCWKPIQVRTAPVRLPSPAMPAAAKIGFWRSPPPAIKPRIYSTRPRGATITRLPTVAAVRLPIIPWRVRPLTNQRTHGQSTARPVPRIITPVQTSIVRRRPGLPGKSYIVSVRTLRAGIIQPTDTTVVYAPASRPRPGPRALVTQTRTGQAQQKSLPAKPQVFLRPALRIWPRAITPAARYLLPSPALHGPMPHPLIIARPRLFDFRLAASYKSISLGSAYPVGGQTPFTPPVPGPAVLPPDLLAAVLAWLRQNVALVAAFGDSTTTPKFGSDLAAAKTAVPYIEFFEPEESKSFETKDGTGLISSVSDGTLACELVGTGKLAVRLLAEQVAAVVNDAPLTFQDGVLIYLFESSLKFPTFRETGPGTNTVIFKRYMEFDYKIERWAPSL